MVKRDFGGDERERCPPGQTLTRKWPVLHEGKPLVFDAATWRLSVRGAVEAPLELDWDALCALPRVERASDFHCVTSWSRLGVAFSGPLLGELAALARVRDDARFVRFADHQGYDTSIPIDIALGDDVLLATHEGGEPLSPEHGGPLRAVVPKLYAWKSCKWVVDLEFLVEDKLGYWEQRGYHNGADPWQEERFD